MRISSSTADRRPPTADRRAAGVLGEPRDLIFEHQGVASPVTGPGECHHHDPVLETAHPWRISLQVRRDTTEIERPPPPSPLTTVLPGTTPRADPTTAGRSFAGPNRRHDRPSLLVEDHLLDHRPLDTEQLFP
jgi:hypothetical protein